MKVSLSFMALCLCSVSALDTFPEKFVAGQISSRFTLTCDKATKNPVTWKLNGDDLDPEDGITEMKGTTLTILKLDEDLIGNFTCWSEEEEVDYTYVLRDMSESINDSPVSCTAETFNCTSTISCTIREKEYQYFRLQDERNANGWLSPSPDGRFYLTHTTNPFAEEAKPIVVKGEGVSNVNYYFKTCYTFYIRDIIKPGCPRVSVLKTDKGNALSVNAPVTWTLPLSYYPLEHEIAFLNKNNGNIEVVTYAQPNNTEASGGTVTIPRGTSKLRARCRDSLLLSQWSEWTAWQNVGKRRPKNGKKQKKKDKKKKGFRHKSR